MGYLEGLLERQYQLERNYRGFLSSLYSSKTATLRSLIENPRLAAEKLNAEWLDHPRMLRRLEATATFFAEIVPHERVPGYRELPLIFLQATDPAEDQQRFEELLGRWEHFQDRYRGKPSEIFYLHIEANFFPELRGTWRSRERVITPLHPFTSRGQLGRDHQGKNWRQKAMIIGYRVPDYSKLLDASKQTATDYFSRSIIHDLGHGFLPDVTPEYESLHNVTMLYAMQIKESNESTNSWQRLIQEECSNPFFFLEARGYLRNLNETTLSPLQQHIIKKYTAWYASDKPRSKKLGRNKEERLEELWSVTRDMDIITQRNKVVETIERMQRNGFAKYQ